MYARGVSNQIENRLLAVAVIRNNLINCQSGFVGNVGDSIGPLGGQVELVFSPDVRVDPSRIMLTVTLANVRSDQQFLGFGANNDRLIWDWGGTEAGDAFDWDLLVYQMPNEAVRP